MCIQIKLRLEEQSDLVYTWFDQKTSKQLQEMTYQTNFVVVGVIGFIEIICIPPSSAPNIFSILFVQYQRKKSIPYITLYLRRCMQETNTPFTRFVTQLRQIASDKEVLFASNC